MPKQVFALDATATHRITVHWEAENNSATVLVNGTILGTFSSIEEKVAGKDFILPDNSPLHVQFFNGYPQAFRAGVPLASVPDMDAVPAPRRKRGGCLTAWLIFNLVVVVALTLLYFMATLGAMANNTTTVSPFVFLLLGVVGIIGIVGLSLLLAWKKWGFYLVAGYVLIGIVLSFVTGSVDVRTFTPLVGVVILYLWLNRSGVWEQLS
ncbi:hypothetical protein [Dictyobacter aurantiacus]|uniref:Uncharacterized protein n=1 Tax=Dictyobacter aurantiacus TaxID=1936993 RepID=A0A401Z8M2_9CHLR|nr:hypothetical protein [Dictyobacter aurantiacus]GCE03168.1 hypothetical protein KDAU_04970 [Dictyobacter aurantiacus]